MSALAHDLLADTPVASPAPEREVTIRPLPPREPPFDDEVDEHRLTGLDGRPLPRIVLGPWDRPLPFVTEVDAPSPLRLVAVTDPFGPQPTGRGALPDPQAWARRVLTTVFEVVAGRRPLRQLAVLAAPAVCAGVAHEVPPAATRRPAAGRSGRSRNATAGRGGRLTRLVAANAQVRSVHVCEPADGVAEVAMTVAARGRVHAVAMRLEGLDGRWRCTKLEVG